MNNNNDILHFYLDSDIDGLGYKLSEESRDMEESKEEEYLSCEDEYGFSYDSNDNFIDYSALATSIRSANPTYQFDTDLDDLQINDVCLLLILLLLGIILIGGKGR